MAGSQLCGPSDLMLPLTLYKIPELTCLHLYIHVFYTRVEVYVFCTEFVLIIHVCGLYLHRPINYVHLYSN